MPRSKPLAASTIKKELAKLRAAQKNTALAPDIKTQAVGAAASLEWITGEGSPPMTRLVVAARPRVRLPEVPAPPPPLFIPDAYVAPGGGTGTGSIIDPWSLAHFCSGASGGVIPGVRVAMRGGTYTSVVTSTNVGTLANPVLLRQYPGERATLNGSLTAHGAYERFWGFEVKSPTPNGAVVNGIQGRSAGSKYINLVTHDASGVGLTLFDDIGGEGDKPDQEAYGVISYNNGNATAPQDHGIYIASLSGYRKIRHCIAFNNWGFGFHAYDEDGNLRYVTLDGNISFNNGSISGWPGTSGEIILGGTGGPVIGGVVTNNRVYRIEDWTAVIMGLFSGGVNTDLIFEDNDIYGLTEIFDFSSASVKRNRSVLNSLSPFIGDGYVVTTRGAWATRGDVGGHDYDANAWYAPDATDNLWGYWAAGDPGYPAGSLSFAAWKTATGKTNPGSVIAGTPPNKISVFPNEYEPGKANIEIKNWDLSSSVSVPLSNVLAPGDQYEILNVQDYYGTPVVSSVYTGGSVSIPMAGIAAPVPVDRGVAGPMTGPQYQAFVVRLVGA